MMINKKLLSFASRSKKWIFLMVLSKLSVMLLNVVVIVNIALIIEMLYIGKWNGNDLAIMAVIMIMAVLSRFILIFTESRFSFLSSSNIKLYLRESIYRKLLEIETEYVEKAGTASIVASAVDGVEALEVYYGRYLPQLFYCLIAPIILFIIVSKFYFMAALVLLLSVPFIPFSIIMVTKLVKKLMKQFWKNYEDLGDYFLESLQGLTTLKILGAEDNRAKKLSENAWKFRNITMKAIAMQLSSLTLMDMVAFCGTATGMLITILALRKGNISVDEAIVVLLLAPEFFIPLRVLGSYFHAAMNGVAAAEKVFKLLEWEKSTPNTSTDREDPVPELEFKNVSFSYDKEKWALCNVSFHIPQGSVCALIGESGCGKSTIASLLMRFYEPNSGNITFGGIDIRNLPVEMLRKQITLITHNTYIFAGSVADNLKLAKADASESEMMNACEMAGLREFIRALPQGIHTQVGERGIRISGGQKQRLGIARAILYGADFYIFDEATFNVDIESENAIWQSIYNLAEKKTLLIISHRLATIKNADKIIVLENGKIIEQGVHKELIKINSTYKKLVDQQWKYESFGEGGTIP